MKAFRVAGTFLMGRRRQAFAKEVTATSPQEAREKVLSDLGSRHRAKRGQVEIAEVVELRPDEVSDPAVEHLLGGE